MKEWSVSLSVNKYDLKGERFIIRVFLGQVPDNPEDWPLSNTCAGSFPVFPPPSTTTGPYPIITAYSEIDLTKALAENGIDESDEDTVEKWLKANLSWHVQKVG
jgi:tyrosinase